MNGALRRSRGYSQSQPLQVPRTLQSSGLSPQRTVSSSWRGWSPAQSSRAAAGASYRAAVVIVVIPTCPSSTPYVRPCVGQACELAFSPFITGPRTGRSQCGAIPSALRDAANVAHGVVDHAVGAAWEVNLVGIGRAVDPLLLCGARLRLRNQRRRCARPSGNDRSFSTAVVRCAVCAARNPRSRPVERPAPDLTPGVAPTLPTFHPRAAPAALLLRPSVC